MPQLPRPAEAESALDSGGAAARRKEVSALDVDLPASPSTVRNADTSAIVQLSHLHGKLRAAGLEARRATHSWHSHVHKCLFFEDIAARQFKSAAELIGGRPCRSAVGRETICNRIWFTASLCQRRFLIVWFRVARTKALKALSAACALLSAIVVLGQLTMFADHWQLSLLSVLFRSDHGPWTCLFCVVPLGYMAYTAYFTIFRVKIYGWYGLYGNHHTDIASLLWCASLLARLSSPLCYHFLLLIHVHDTSFQAFMGQMNVVPALGTGVNRVFPCFIALLSCCNLFNVHSRAVELLSFGYLESEFASVMEGEDPLGEGRQLIERERRRLVEDALFEMPSRERLAMPLAVPSS